MHTAKFSNIFYSHVVEWQFAGFRRQETNTNNRTAASVEQDQTARMYRLILSYTFREINPLSRTSGQGLIHFCLFEAENRTS